MARQALATTGPALTEERIAATEGEFKGLVVALDAQAEEAREREERAKDLAHRTAFEGVLTLAAVDDRIRLYQRRTVDDCLELGKALLIRRELTPRGEFDAALEGLGFGRATAYRFMAAAYRATESSQMRRLVEHVDQIGKVLELLVIDDDEAGALLEGDTVRGLQLDDVERMTASQLRKALRDARQINAAKDEVLSDKNARIDKLATELEVAKRKRGVKVAEADPDEERSALLVELLKRTATIEALIIGNLHLALTAVRDHADATGLPADDAIAGALGQIQRALAEVRYTHAVKMVPDGELMPTASIWDAVNADFDRQAAKAQAQADGSVIEGEAGRLQ